MKKNKMNRLLKFGIFLFGVSFFIVSCQKDDDFKQNEQTLEKVYSPFKITKIVKAELENNKKIKRKLTKLSEIAEKNKNSSQSKTVVSSQYGFSINTDYVNYMESADGSYHSYTFPIERTIETDSIENLVLSLKPDGSYKTLIVTYNTTAQEKLDIENRILVDLTNKVSKYEINDDGLVTDIFNKAIECLEIVVGYCSYGNHEDGYLDNGDNCPGYSESTIATIGDCGSGGGSSSGTSSGSGSTGSGSTGGSSTGGGSTGGGTSGGGQTNNGGSSNNSSNDGNDATTPIVPCRGDDCPEEFDDGTPNTPCQELQEVSNTPSKLAKLIDLKNNTSLNQEVGFTRTDSIVGSPNSTVEYQDLIWNATLQQLVANTLNGQLYSDYGHTHFDTENQLSVFSLSDIHTIFSLLEGANISSEEFNVFLVTEHGTKYALKFKDLQGVQDFVNFGNNWFSDWGVSSSFNGFDSKQKKIEDKFSRKIKSSKSNAKNEKNFAKFLDKYSMGLDLYKANDDFSQWEKVNPDGTTTPC